MPRVITPAFNFLTLILNAVPACQINLTFWDGILRWTKNHPPVMLLYCLNRDFNRSELIKVCRNTTISSPIIPMLATPWRILYHLWFYLILSKYSKRPANWVDFVCRLFVNYKFPFFSRAFWIFYFSPMILRKKHDHLWMEFSA